MTDYELTIIFLKQVCDIWTIYELSTDSTHIIKVYNEYDNHILSYYFNSKGKCFDYERLF